jgi:hypothetical protein
MLFDKMAASNQHWELCLMGTRDYPNWTEEQHDFSDHSYCAPTAAFITCRQ